MPRIKSGATGRFKNGQVDADASSPYLTPMPLNLTKIAFGAQSFSDLESWYANRRSPNLTTRYRPTRWEECIGGSLFWIHQHNIVARS